MPDSPTSDAEPSFVCDCGESMRSACAGEPSFGTHESKQYCVLHFPGNEKSADFGKALQRKLDNKDFNFGGVWFPDETSFQDIDFRGGADFRSATFNADAYFIRITFSGPAYFSDATFSAAADFTDVTFNAAADFTSSCFVAKAYFGRATFDEEAHFKFATFRAKAYFTSVIFRGPAYFRDTAFRSAAYFSGATFSAAAYFNFATFRAEAQFSDATFDERVRFSGEKGKTIFSHSSLVDLQFATIETPDDVSFHTINLRPHWFVNVDARKFEFTNVYWGRPIINEEIRSLEHNNVASAHELLAIACRRLAVNAEENHRYEEASTFRYMAMDARRVETWRGFVPWRLSWWYWFASGYGERILRALVVFVGVWVIFALVYSNPNLRCSSSRQDPCIGWEKPTEQGSNDGNATLPLKVDTRSRFDSFWSSAMYTLEVMALQKPDPHPKSTLAHLAVTLCAILGPLQGALLALAIRRKFMR